MLKRFYSKRSGFTLVEIIIAFAVFAIMASMICQILQLSVAARRSNNIYQRELAEQEALLTLVEKQNGDFKSEAGTIKLNFGSSTVELPYAMVSANPNLSGDDMYSGEGLNYFVANVNYGATGEIPIGDENGSGNATNNTGSQASRMDTRITGTGGIGFVRIWDVVKDTHTYAAGDPFAVPEGHTRYFITCSASENVLGGDVTLQDEDVPYSQYRLYFYDDVALNEPASKISYTDSDKKKYTKDVPATLKITKVGYLSTNVDEVAKNGLKSSYVQSGTSASNMYTIEQMGTNGVRIGSPFVSWGNKNPGLGGRGERFQGSVTSKFYIEFENVEVPDPADNSKTIKQEVTLTKASFGYNGIDKTADNMDYIYPACPAYIDEYDNDGTPKYNSDGTHVNIYGAFLYTRHYEGGGS